MVDGTRVAHFEVEKNNLFWNFSKSAQYFFLIFFVPHRRVFKTYYGIFRIEKIGKFCTQKSPNVFVFFEKKVEKIIIFVNISKTAQYFFLIGSGPHRRVLKTYSGIFWIGKIGKFSTKKSPNVFFFFKGRKKHPFVKYLGNCSIFFPDCFWSPQKIFEDIFWNIPKRKIGKIIHSKIA